LKLCDRSALTQFDLPDNVYKWLAEFNEHSHFARYRGDFPPICRSQQVIGYRALLSDHHRALYATPISTTSGHEMAKFADDSYIIIRLLKLKAGSEKLKMPSNGRWIITCVFTNSIRATHGTWNTLLTYLLFFRHVHGGARVFYDKQSRKCGKIMSPPPIAGIKSVIAVKILDVTLSDDLSVKDHVHAVISSAARTLHTLRVLHGHGMDGVPPYSLYFERSWFLNCSTLRMPGGGF